MGCKAALRVRKADFTAKAPALFEQIMGAADV
jgi:hypothetical protein